jgi:phage N-6-adenine-methyltransferase
MYLTVVEQGRLEHNEAIIEKGLNTFVDVGNALAEIRDGKLYRDTHSTFEDYCQERWGLRRSYAYEIMDAASVAGNVRNSGHLLSSVSQARPLARLEPDEQIAAWQEAIETAPNGKVTAAHVAEVVERRNAIVECPICDNLYDGAKFSGCPYCVAKSLGASSPFHVNSEFLPLKKEPHVSHNSGENEWYTPVEYIDAAHAVMGGVDLDPASSDAANMTVGAARYFTAKDDGLAHSWQGRVWMNPPYAQPLIGLFCNALRWAIESGEVTEAITLTNNATETAWFADLLANAGAVCFPRGRIKFIDRDGNPGGAPLQGQAVVYSGPNVDQFASEFGKFGEVLYVRKG